MMVTRHSLYAGLILALLAACGTPPEGGPTMGAAVFGVLKAGVAGIAGSKPASPAPAPQISRAMFKDAQHPITLISIPRRNAVATVVPARTTQEGTTWLSADGVSVVMQSGLVRATRGLGDDLMTADLGDLPGALRAGGLTTGGLTRRMQFLNGLDQIVTHTYECQVSAKGAQQIEILGAVHQTQAFEETCSSGGHQFTNSYWMNDATLWQSHQWISPTVGEFIIQKVQ